MANADGREYRSGMVPSEDQIADIFEQLVRNQMGATPGQRERHDAQPGHLRVDFVYPVAEPEPMALEITSIRWDDMQAQQSNLERLRYRLSSAAVELEAGAWILETEGRRWTRNECAVVEGWVVSCLNAGRGLVPVVPKGLTAIGVNALSLVEGPGHLVAFFSMTGVVTIDGFSQALLEVAAGNASKLAEAAPLVGHLVVYVEFLQGSRDPDRTLPPPAIPETAGIRYVWVLHGLGSIPGERRPWAWWATPGSTEWDTIGD